MGGMRGVGGRQGRQSGERYGTEALHGNGRDPYRGRPREDSWGTEAPRDCKRPRPESTGGPSSRDPGALAPTAPAMSAPRLTVAPGAAGRGWVPSTSRMSVYLRR